MHEFGIVEDLLKQIEACCRENGGERVASVTVALKKGSGYEADHFAFAFDLLKKGSLAERAALTVESAPGEARCLGCGHIEPVEELPASCPQCRGDSLVWMAAVPAMVKELVVEP